MKVLVVEEAGEAAESIRLGISIRWPGSTILTAADGAAGVRLAKDESPDLLILDLELAEGSGRDALEEIRRFSDLPVLVVSATADEVGRVRGLELGADDFIVKPFSLAELQARVRATLQRAHRPQEEARVVEGKDLSIDLDAGRVYVAGREMELSATEWRLLAYFARNPGKVLSHRSLIQNVWGLDFVESSTIKMCIRRLRQKLGDDTQAPRLIRSYRGRGYAFEIRR